MQNERPLSDPRTQEALDKIRAVYDEYDLCGGAFVTNAEEMGFTYQCVASWTCVYDDPHTPLGLRIRARSTVDGEEQTRRRMEGGVWMFAAMRDFGMQTFKWAEDFLRILRGAGVDFHAEPFGGQPASRLGTIAGMPASPDARPPISESPRSRAERRREKFGRN